MQNIAVVSFEQPDDARAQALFQQFLSLYEAAFDNPDVIEDPDDWLDRLAAAGHRQPVCSFIELGVASDTGGERVLGGIVYDYFPRSGTGLISYLVIHPELRGRRSGLARRLLDQASERLGAFAETEGGEFCGLFAETERFRLGSEDRNALLNEDVPRLRALAGLGFQWLDVDYVQPALSRTLRPEEQMLLLTRPVQDADRLSIPRRTVSGFLRDYYATMAELQNAAAAQVVAQAEQRINGELLSLARHYMGGDFVAGETAADRIRYREIPDLEWPTYRLTHVAVTLHVVTEDAEPKAEGDHCPYFNTFEKDIVSHLFHDSELFQSFCYAESPSLLTVHFPERLRFDAEGISKTVESLRSRLPVLVNLSYTRFFESGTRIWHLSLRPDPDAPEDLDHFTEYDIIKLINLKPSAQEQAGVAGMRFTLGDGMPLEFSGLFEALTGETAVSAPLGSTVLLDPAQSRQADAPDWHEMFTRLHEIRRDNHVDTEELAELDSILQYPQTRALAGIVDGIFEFSRIEADEVLDMLTPVIPVVPHIIHLRKGHLTSLTSEDLLYDHEVCQRTIGNNPYLIIAHAVVLHNLHQIEQADRLLTAAQQTTDLASATSRQRQDVVARLSQLDEDLKRILHRYVTPNLFVYKTERSIYNVGMDQDDALVKKAFVERKMLEMRARHDRFAEDDRQQASRREQRHGYLMNGMLALITLLQAFNLLHGGTLVSWIGLGVVALFLLVLMLNMPRRR